jgi:hypothetical protein
MLVAQSIRHSKTLAEVVNEKKERDGNKAISKATTACGVAASRKHKRKKAESINQDSGVSTATSAALLEFAQPTAPRVSFRAKRVISRRAFPIRRLLNLAF